VGRPERPRARWPGAGAKVSPNVDYTPWLVSRAPGGACVGGLPSTPGKVTGGGQIPGDDPLFSLTGDLLSIPGIDRQRVRPQRKATFGFVVSCCAPTGKPRVRDQQADVRIRQKRLMASSSVVQGVMSGSAWKQARHVYRHGPGDPVGWHDHRVVTVEVDDLRRAWVLGHVWDQGGELLERAKHVDRRQHPNPQVVRSTARTRRAGAWLLTAVRIGARPETRVIAVFFFSERGIHYETSALPAYRRSVFSPRLVWA